MNAIRHLSRRHFLHGAGVSMVLPHLDSLARDSGKAASDTPPRRFLALYVGHGFAITLKDDHPARDWSWYPRSVDGEMTFGRSMASLQPFDLRTPVGGMT